MDKNILIQFIEEHPALTIKEIANATNFSQSLLYGILSGEKNLKGDKAFEIAKVLSHYGLTLRGWVFKPYDAEYLPLMLEAYRFTDDEQEDFEETSGIIKYRVIIQKDTFDEFDFASFIGVGY
jgi:transcriptional regulator with XRE-family HTH domain